MRFSRRATAGDRPTKQIPWFRWMLLLLAVLYWLFARHLERIDLTPVFDPWWQTNIPFFPLPRWFVFLAEMIRLRVLRHLLAAIIGWLLAKSAAVSLVQTLYDLPDRESAKLFLGRLKAPGGSLGKAVSTSSTTLAADREESVVLRVGGPGKVNISDQEVAVTEINGRFHRVLGPGGSKLDRLERIYAVLDLREQERVIKACPLMTKDGIEMTADIALTFRISTGGESPTRAKPFPYDEQAVRQAAYAETVLAEGQVATWEAIPVEVAKVKLARIIAKYQLDQLLYPRSLAADPNLVIRKELERLVRATLIESGIELTGLHMVRLVLPEDVVDQYVDYWQAHWETQSQLVEADGEAYSLEEVEIARAEAEVTMIRAIVEGLQRARLESGTEAVQEIVALRLVEALEKVAEQSQQQFPLPTDLLPQLTSLSEQLRLEEP